MPLAYTQKVGGFVDCLGFRGWHACTPGDLHVSNPNDLPWVGAELTLISTILLCSNA